MSEYQRFTRFHLSAVVEIFLNVTQAFVQPCMTQLLLYFRKISRRIRIRALKDYEFGSKILLECF